MNALVQKGIAQGRPMALAVTIALHVALVAGLLAMKVVQSISDAVPPVTVKWFEPENPRVPPPDMPTDPRLVNPGRVPAPEQQLRLTFEEDTLVLPPDDGVAVVVDPPLVQPLIAVVPDTPLRYRALRSPDEFYPPQAIRLGIEGATVVKACVDAQGAVAGTPAVVRSSRQALLDAAAVRWAGEALQFQAATQGGVAIAACKEFRVSFTLH